MKPERQSLRIGTAVVLCAVLLRLLTGNMFGTIVRALGSQEVASALFYLETGRVIRPVEPDAPEQTVPPTEPETQPTSEPTAEPAATSAVTPIWEPYGEAAVPVFAASDASDIQMGGNCSRSVDLPALVQQTLSWDLADSEPAVLIVHTHATESYVNNEGYQETSPYRTLDEKYNMVSVGDRIAEVLESGGVKTLHDRTLHDYPNYSGSYNHSRKSIEQYLKEYPSIRMVLDIHRDSVENSAGEEIGYRLQVGEKKAAKLMLVVGTDTNLSHPNWRENMALAAKLYAQLEKNNPGICRPINLRKERFNQDMTGGSLLVEVGASGNTHDEALLAGELLAKSILALARGANY